MNHLLIGSADKTLRLLQITKPPFLLIDDGPIADAFLKRFSRAKLFDIAKHSFDPLQNIDYKRARDFASAVYSASPEGRETLTVRNGRRALTRLVLDHPARLDKLPVNDEETAATIGDLLLSPVLRKVLCNPTNFRFKGAVVAKLNRAELGDFDAFLLATLLIGQCKGQIIVPDFGFYGRDFYTPLLRQSRLTAGLNFLDELPVKLRQALLTVKDKVALGCVWEDAELLAKYAGLTPGTTAYTDYVQHATLSLG